MNRTITSFIASFVAATIFIAAMAPAAFAQHPNDWANVQSVGIDEDLSITLKDGHKNHRQVLERERFGADDHS